MPGNEPEKKDEFYFVQLVMTFQAAAMQQMGKLQNPITKKVERNLDQARFSIDMLEMLRDKTENNLSENEKKFLEQALFELRMNYVDEVKKEEQEKEEKEKGKEQPKAEKSEARPDEEEQEAEDSAGKEGDEAHSGSDSSKEKKD